MMTEEPITVQQLIPKLLKIGMFAPFTLNFNVRLIAHPKLLKIPIKHLHVLNTHGHIGGEMITCT